MDTSTIAVVLLGVVCVVAAIGAILNSAAAGKSRLGSLARVTRSIGNRSSQEESSASMIDAVGLWPVAGEPMQPDGVPPAEDQVPAAEQPRIWYLPRASNSRFAHRGTLIDEIRSTLVSDRNAVLVDPGLGGGVGKRQLAAEYAHGFRDEYSVVWWLRASDSSLLTADYIGLVWALGLGIDDAGPEEIEQYVSFGLRQRSSWLLIYDDAASPEFLRNHLPNAENGHIIVTSRSPDWWQLCTPISVGVFERIGSIDLLFARTKDNNGAAAAQLAGLLQDLPIAIDQACAYVAKSDKPASEYLGQVRSRKKEAASQIGGNVDHSQVVAVTASLSMEQVSKEAPAAGSLMSLLAFFAPQVIPTGLLRKAVSDISVPKISRTDPSSFDNALRILERYALVEVSEDHIFVHGMVQSAIRGWLPEKERAAWAELAARLNRQMFTFDARDRSCQRNCAAMLPHALAAVSHADALEVVTETDACLLEEAALFLRSCGEFEESKRVAAQALVTTEAIFGSQHPRIAVCADNLGAILQEMGDLAGALSQYERALKIDETAYGHSHPTVATHMGNVGSVMCEMGNYTQARAYLERALKVAETTYGANHPNVAARATPLAHALTGLGEMEAAKALLERALAIEEASFGPTHPCVAESAHALGQLHWGLGDADQAIEYLDRALKIEKAIYGTEHPRVAARAVQLGCIFEACDELAAAKDCFEEAVAIDELAYGEWHPLMAARNEELGRVLEKMRDYQTAVWCFERALAIQERVYDPDHAKVAEAAVRLGNVYRAMGDLPAARRQYERAIEIHQTAYGPTDPIVADDLVLLSKALTELGNSKDARVHLGRALLIRQEKLGLSHPDTESIRNSLAGSIY